MRILVTGHRGHVGAPVAGHLVRLGHEVAGFDRVDGLDLLDLEAVRSAAEGCAAVVHMAALAHDTAGSPEQIMAVNVLGTWHVLLAAEAAAVRRVIYFSSAQVFGIAEAERLPDYFSVDDAHPRRATRAYGLSKCLAAVIGATAGSAVILTAARCLQGAAAALSVPSALRLLTTITADGPQRRKAIAVWSAAGAAAGASGFVAGGVVTDLVGWRAVFWAYVPLAIALAVAIGRAVPPDHAADRSIRLSLASSAIFTAAVMAFVVATTLLPEQRRAVPGIVLLGSAAMLAWLFIAIDRRSPAPLLPRALLRERPLRQGAVGALLNTLTTSSVLTLATLYMQNTRARSPLVAGLMLLPFSLAVIAGSALAAPLLARWRPQRVVAAGLTAIAVCDAALILAASSSWALPMCVAVGGAGIGMSSVAATGLGTSVAVSVRGTASGIINTAAQLGTAVGIAMLLLVAALTTGVPEPHKPVPAVAWGLAALISLAGAVIFGIWDRRAAPREAQQPRRLAADSQGR